MVRGSGKPPGSGGKRGEGGKGKLPPPPRLAHDEFEVDIDVDTDMTAVASEVPPAPDLFDDDEEEATMEIAIEQLEEQLRPKGDNPIALPTSSDDEILPMFLPTEQRQKLPPPPLEPERPSPRQARLPSPTPSDLSALLDDGVEIDSGSVSLPKTPQPRIPPPVSKSPSSESLFSDVSGLHDDPVPIQDLSQVDDEISDPGLPMSSLPPPESSDKQPRFSKGFSSGMKPLDIGQFECQEESQNPSGRKKRRGSSRGGPAPMAGSNRMVRRWFQFGLRDILLLVLILLVGVGIYVGWLIWQDYKSRVDADQFTAGRDRFEQSRDDVIERSIPKRVRDDP